ncbi:MAG: hypothetical protein QXF82_10710 [Nitrososphaeria archaeon]
MNGQKQDYSKLSIHDLLPDRIARHKRNDLEILRFYSDGGINSGR